MDNKEKLRQRLRKKRENRKKLTDGVEPVLDENADIFKMMEHVNKILKSNPQMVQQISKCVSNVMSNKDLMESISSELETQIKKEEGQEETLESSSECQDQTLESSSEGESSDASANESTQ